MTNVKKMIQLLAIVGLVAGLSVAAAAQCSPGVAIGQVAGLQDFGATGGLGTTLLTSFWQVGAGGTANSGTLADDTMCTSYGTGYYVSTDWGNTGVVGCPCPGGNCGTSRTAFLYSRANAGQGQFLVMSVAYSGSYFNFDNITNGPGNIISALAIPALSVSGNTGPGTATVTWSNLNSSLKGYYDAAPTNNMITGYTIRYLATTGNSTPASYATSAWTPCTTGSNVNIGLAGTDPGTATVTFPAPVNAGDRVYLAMSILFDGATAGDPLRETQFVGQPSGYFGPTAAPLFNTVEASTSTVNFTSGTETRVASYQAFWAPSLTNTFQAVGQPVAALGSGSSYSINYRVMTTAPSYYVKVKASKTDGTFEWSAPVLVQKSTKISPTTKPITKVR